VLLYSPKNKNGWRKLEKYRVKAENRHVIDLNDEKKEVKPRNSMKLPSFNWKRWFKLSAIALAALILVGVFALAWMSRDLPDPNKLIDRKVAQSTIIYDRTGEHVLYEVHGDQKRTLINLSDLPDYVKWATISIEDKDFYKHKGFSLWAIFRTAVTNVLFGKNAGGSTLTQQFVKNAVLTTEKKYTRKIKELILAYRLERNFSKDEILQMYFNEIPYGSTAYGVEAASLKYFGKSAKDLTMGEAAILAAIPQAPSRYSPYGPNRNLLLGRQEYILDKMAEYGHITQEQADIAKKEVIKFKEQAENIIAPHFVMYIKEILGDKLGDKEVEQGGYKIYTTLDLTKQRIAEETVKEGALKNEKKYNATNAALVAIDPKTGQILAMAGSRDYFDTAIDGQVNISTSPRQPGSSLKPLVYSTAFTKGYTPNTILYDVVTNFSTDKSKTYEPRNYNGKEYGPISMRNALAGSLNTPAVKTLYLAGLNNVLAMAKTFGYTTLTDIDRFGLSLVLGGGEVKLLEHVNAYGVFARDGLYHPATGILKIVDHSGKTVEEFKNEESKAIDGNIAREINSILTDNSARAFIFGSKNYLTLSNRPVGAKTGTTNDFRDAWTIGYTPSIVAGVWVGNNDNSPMDKGADGSVVAAPIWNDFMKRVLGDTPVEQFKKPEIPHTGKGVLDGSSGETTVKIDVSTGLLATDLTPPDMVEEKTFRDAHCILYYVNKDDPTGPYPANPYDDPQFVLWESRVQAWAEKNKYSTSTPPTEKDNVHIAENVPTITIVTPASNQVITDPSLVANIDAQSKRGIVKADYYIDEKFFSEITAAPFYLVKDIGFLNNGYHQLTVKACDDVGNCKSEKTDFNLSLPNPQTGDLEISLLWNYPVSDLTVSTSSFPLLLKLDASNLPQIAEIKAFYTGGGQTKSIYTANAVSVSPVEMNWRVSPPPGTYRLYAEASGWNGQKSKTSEITIIIKK
jgi:1A family penicillin-binding protein